MWVVHLNGVLFNAPFPTLAALPALKQPPTAGIGRQAISGRTLSRLGGWPLAVAAFRFLRVGGWRGLSARAALRLWVGFAGLRCADRSRSSRQPKQGSFFALGWFVGRGEVVFCWVLGGRALGGFGLEPCQTRPRPPLPTCGQGVYPDRAASNAASAGRAFGLEPIG